MMNMKDKIIEMTKYKKVDNNSQHGSGFFSIEDLEDDEVDEEMDPHREIARSLASGGDSSSTDADGSWLNSLSVYQIWNTLTFAWMQNLLKKGNEKPLTLEDLDELPKSDSSEGVFKRFSQVWNKQMTENASPSLTWTFVFAFGKPFIAAGFLKLVHDSSLFVGPMLLNALIKYLSDPSKPLSLGLMYVLGLFLSNFMMSLCLRQYFWWCYRVGMNLRSAVITSVYSKALVISTAALGKKSTGEITNLMSVDSTRLQELTPYLHAIWYSFYQIVVAMYLLWQQLGASCLAGMTVIILGIPTTSRVSLYMKTLQRELSKVRDERIKLSNEVLSGMKVIKLQAWEKEFQNRLLEVRENELRIFRKYAIVQSFAGILSVSIPLMVAIFTFMTYVSLGNELTVATALTSLALFEVLRFPLFMLPQVINNLIEARVSVDRIQSFLLQPEVNPVPTYPLKKQGVLLDSATLVWENAVYKYKLNQLNNNAVPPKPTVFSQLVQTGKEKLGFVISKITLGKLNLFQSASVSSNPGAVTISSLQISDEEMDLIVKDALLVDSENIIKELERELKMYRKYNTVDYQDDEDSEPSSPFIPRGDAFDSNYIDSFNNRNVSSLARSSLHQNMTTSTKSEGNAGGDEKRLLTLSRISMFAQKGQLISIVGQVGSGKSSLLNGLLGNLRICLGNVALYGEVAYAAQLAFIQNSTLRDNILYGKPYDEAKYQKTLEMCALLPDLDVLPAGDMTEIGERGINLSGGQKARVGLARAVYSDADIYLLDDPLSAVDAHVGKHLFEECILKLKEMNKCIIFVTNALHFVKHSTKIYVLKDGHVAESGNYVQLLKRGNLFTDMINTLKETGNSAGLAVTEEDGDEVPIAVAEPIHEINLLDDDEPNEKQRQKELIADDVKTRAKSSSFSGQGSEKKKSNPQETKKVEKPSASTGKLISTEDQEVGDVDFKVYLKWSTAAGGVMVGVILICLFYAVEIITMSASWWLSFWSQHRNSGSPWFYLGIYILINFGIVVVGLVREVYVRLRSLDASRELFHELLSAVLYAPMSFFDTTPLGRIVNRFSKDVYTVDEQIPFTVRGYITTMARVSCVLAYIVLITPLFIFGLVPLFIFYYMAQRYYIKSSRELTRIESTARSPIYALFSETLDGITTIRAYHAEKRLIQKNNRFLDNNQKAYFLNFSANCWLAVRLEFVGTLIVTFAALFAVLAREAYISKTSFPNDTNESQNMKTVIFAGLAGLSISFALNITQSLNWTVRMASDLESQMVSVERIKSYAGMKQEASHYLINDPKTIHTINQPLELLSRPLSRNQSSDTNNPLRGSLNYWPSRGKIVVNNICLRYRENLPLVLNNCSFTVQAAEKIGIVGRTGAGKSSIVTALLRLVELESGDIFIDDLNTRTIGLNTLRSVMAVIPQDPVLFSGTIRSNLDPFKRYTDAELWDILRRTLLSDHIQSLDDTVQENGSNYSVGQRQLLCIARALLSKATIIIMDEATAAVDLETDAAIQKAIKTEFAHATCLTVAHRLNTIMDSDKVLVMDAGRVAEYDTPQKLLSNEHSMFAALVANWENSHANNE